MTFEPIILSTGGKCKKTHGMPEQNTRNGKTGKKHRL